LNIKKAVLTLILLVPIELVAYSSMMISENNKMRQKKARFYLIIKKKLFE